MWGNPARNFWRLNHDRRDYHGGGNGRHFLSHSWKDGCYDTGLRNGGRSATNVTLGEWAATLALLIGGGELGEAEGPLYELAERAQPTREHLIGLHEVGEEELKAAVNALRLIP